MNNNVSFGVNVMSRNTISVTAFLVGIAVIPSFAQELTRGPYIQNLKTSSVEVLWRTDVPTESRVEIRRQGSRKKNLYYSNVPTTTHQMQVPGLQADTFYEYRVGFGKGRGMLSEPTMFHTFAGADAIELEFIAFGDHRNYPEDHRAVVLAVLEKAEERGFPRFVLDTGDYTGQGEHKTDFWDEQFFEPARGLIERVCYFPVIGNHESYSKHPRIPFRYLENFSVPTENSGTEYYYSFDFGNAHFCMIDVYASKFHEGSKQYEWIRQDLKKSPKPWKFAAMHFPIYVYRSAPSVTYGNEEVREHLVPLFQKYGVTAVFSGDSHFYQRSEVDGIHYICTGGAGAPLYTPSLDAPYVKAARKAHHYTWVKISGDEMTLWAYDTHNGLIDTFTTAPRKPIEKPKPKLNFVRRLPEKASKPGEVFIIESRDAEGDLTPAPAYVELGGMAGSSAKSTAKGLSGQGSRFSDNQEADGKVRFTPPLKEKGTYLISVTVPSAGSINAPNSLFEVTRGEKELIRGRIDLSRTNAGDKWYDIGLFELSPGDSITLIEVEDEPDRFYADGVKFTKYEQLK